MSLKIKNLKYCLTVSKKANLEVKNFSILSKNWQKVYFSLFSLLQIEL